VPLPTWETASVSPSTEEAVLAEVTLATPAIELVSPTVKAVLVLVMPSWMPVASPTKASAMVLSRVSSAPVLLAVVARVTSVRPRMP